MKLGDKVYYRMMDVVYSGIFMGKTTHGLVHVKDQDGNNSYFMPEMVSSLIPGRKMRQPEMANGSRKY